MSMLPVLLVASAAFSSAPQAASRPPAAKPRPASVANLVVPAGSNSETQGLFAAAAKRLAAGDFAAASRLTARLPSPRLRVAWDDRKVPAELRARFRQERDEAMRLASLVLKVPVALATNGPIDVAFSFEPVLAKSANAIVPAGAALFWADRAGRPRLEAVLGLRRGEPSAPIDPVNVHNEVAFALATAQGLSALPVPGVVMGRTDLNARQRLRFAEGDPGTAKEILAAAEFLRKAVAEKRRNVGFAPASGTLDTKAIDLGDIPQGPRKAVRLMLTNTGSGPLRYRLVPDCGCLAVNPSGEVAPGRAQFLNVALETIDYSGPQEKTLMVLTNDAENPVRKVAIRTRILPRYRFFTDGGPTWTVPDEGAKIRVDLAIRGEEVPVLEASLAGAPAKVTWVPWSGLRADPEMGEAEAARSGYRFTIEVPGNLPYGRAMTSLTVRLGSPRQPLARMSLLLQRGILASPEDLFLGDLGAQAKSARVSLSRPGVPFKVREASVDHPSLRAVWVPNAKGDGGEVEVRYDGKAAGGDLLAQLVILTDDARQPRLVVPIRAYVK